MQVILDSSFARPGSAPIWGGKKGEFRDWTRVQLAAGPPRNAMFLWFFRSFRSNFRCKRVIQFLRRLKEAHLRFLDLKKKLKILKKRVRA